MIVLTLLVIIGLMTGNVWWVVFALGLYLFANMIPDNWGSPRYKRRRKTRRK